jgi:hypothetical protein
VPSPLQVPSPKSPIQIQPYSTSSPSGLPSSALWRMNSERAMSGKPQRPQRRPALGGQVRHMYMSTSISRTALHSTVKDGRLRVQSSQAKPSSARQSPAPALSGVGTHHNSIGSCRSKQIRYFRNPIQNLRLDALQSRCSE